MALQLEDQYIKREKAPNVVTFVGLNQDGQD